MGFVYALIAAGLSLIFGLMEIVNFAHGEFLMLAMFSTYWAWALWRLDPVLSLPLTAAVLFLLGFATYHGLIRWVLGAPMLAQIFATFGLAIFLRSAAQAIWGVDFHLVKDPLVEGRISLGGLFIGLPQLVASRAFTHRNPPGASTSSDTASEPRSRFVRLATESVATSLPWLIMMTLSHEFSISERM